LDYFENFEEGKFRGMLSWRILSHALLLESQGTSNESGRKATVFLTALHVPACGYFLLESLTHTPTMQPFYLFFSNAGRSINQDSFFIKSHKNIQIYIYIGNSRDIFAIHG